MRSHLRGRSRRPGHAMTATLRSVRRQNALNEGKTSRATDEPRLRARGSGSDGTRWWGAGAAGRRHATGARERGPRRPPRADHVDLARSQPKRHEVAPRAGPTNEDPLRFGQTFGRNRRTESRRCGARDHILRNEAAARPLLLAPRSSLHSTSHELGSAHPTLRSAPACRPHHGRAVCRRAA